MLGDRDARRRRNQRRGGRQVDRTHPVAAGAGGAQDRPDRIRQAHGAFAERHGGADQFIDGFALDPQGHEKSGDLRGLALVIDEGADRRRHFGGGQVFAAGDLL